MLHVVSDTHERCFRFRTVAVIRSPCVAQRGVRSVLPHVDTDVTFVWLVVQRLPCLLACWKPSKQPPKQRVRPCAPCNAVLSSYSSIMKRCAAYACVMYYRFQILGGCAVVAGPGAGVTVWAGTSLYGLYPYPVNHGGHRGHARAYVSGAFRARM